MKLSKHYLGLLALIIITPVVLLFCCQAAIIYHPKSYNRQYIDMFSELNGISITYYTSQGRQTAYFIPSRRGSISTAPLWLGFSGNANLALDWLPFILSWNPKFSYLLIDYPSYGNNEGRPNPERIRESTKAAFVALSNHLKVAAKELNNRTFVFGHSLGAAAAIMAAEDLNLNRAVLVSPFTTMTEMGRLRLGWPLCYLCTHNFDNQQSLRVVASRKNAKVIIFHGTNDKIIPVDMGRELFIAHPNAVIFQEISQAGHNDILNIIDKKLGRLMQNMAFQSP